MAKRNCIDYVEGFGYGLCWCDENGELVCVELPEEFVDRELERGTPWCTKNFCKEVGSHGLR